MNRIKHLADDMKDELCSAKEYAEKALDFKVKDNSMWAQRFKEMANEELKHAKYLHELVVGEIQQLSTVYEPPTEMMEKWEKDHKRFIEEHAWIEKMLEM